MPVGTRLGTRSAPSGRYLARLGLGPSAPALTGRRRPDGPESPSWVILPVVHEQDASPPQYDLSYRDAFWKTRGYEDRCDRLSLRAMLKGASGTLLDLGAGFGRLADEYGAFDHVTLVDASPVMVSAARERIGPNPRFTIIEAEGASMPIPTGSIDVVVSVRLLLHIQEPGPVFAEIARVLRPGGRLILEFPNRGHLVSRLRYLVRRQDWAPGAPEPHEYLPGHFSHQPARVEEQMRAAGLEPVERRSVSLFRSSALKKRIPAQVLAAVEAPLQRPLGRLAPGPAVYVLARPGAGPASRL